MNYIKIALIVLSALALVGPAHSFIGRLLNGVGSTVNGVGNLVGGVLNGVGTGISQGFHGHHRRPQEQIRPFPYDPFYPGKGEPPRQPEYPRRPQRPGGHVVQPVVKPAPIVQPDIDEDDDENVDSGNEYPPAKPIRKPHHPISEEKPSVDLFGKSYPNCKTTEGLSGLCREATYCFHQYGAQIAAYVANKCRLGGDSTSTVVGVCCPLTDTRPIPKSHFPIRIPYAYKPKSSSLRLRPQEVDGLAKKALQKLKQQLAHEMKLLGEGHFQRVGSSEFLAQSFFGPFKPLQEKLAKKGHLALETGRLIAATYGLEKDVARDSLHAISLRGTSLEADFCLPDLKCPERIANSKYRTMDGSCNNLAHPTWGMSNSVIERLAPPAYSDGLSDPRKGIDGNYELPSARLVSSHLAHDVDLEERRFSLFLMQWGQMIDHDLTLSASTRASNGEGLECCHKGPAAQRHQKPIEHPACIPIDIPSNDPFYSKFGQKCINQVRNAPSPRPGCALGPREQTNQLTQVIDGSMVYGSDAERATHLRANRDGLLRFIELNGREFMPHDSDNRSDECAIEEGRQRRGIHCFVAGDVRVNEQIGLTVIHNLLMREHNRIARRFKDLNPTWRDETIFQEARRLLAAQVQHITYNEWMPLVLGRRVMHAFNILPKPSGYSHDYDSHLNPNILNEFATAAYRFHSLIQGTLKPQSVTGEVFEEVPLRTVFNNPARLYTPRNYDGFLNGLLSQGVQTYDEHFTREITQHLFQERNHSFGMDLIALNLQRGREHGLPGYNTYRAICGLPLLEDWQDLASVLREPKKAELFSKLYRDVNDIDLFIGGVHEAPLPDVDGVPGAIVGPTFACILAEQARRNKLGDRFWYENGKMRHSFSPEQVEEVRKASLARLVCDNSNEIRFVQPLAFLRENPKWNPKLDCDSIATVNLDLWKGEPI